MLPSVPAKNHLPRLDSVRGLAALAVAGFHALAAGPTALGHHVVDAASFIFDGRLGVVIFFVLSGLVLGYSLRRSGRLTFESYVQFCVRRVFRIFPAYFICGIFYLILYLYVHAHPGPRVAFLQHYVYEDMSLRRLVGNFFFLDQGLNGVTWTLKVEILTAFLLPFMHWYSGKVGWQGKVLLLAALLVVGFLPGSRPTRMCLYLFYTGYLLSPLIQHPSSERDSASSYKLWLLLFLAGCAFALGHLFPFDESGRRFVMLGGAVGSAALFFLLIVAPEMPAFRFLDQKWARYLGKISYSFYLYNLFCLDVIQWFGPWPHATSSAFSSVQVLVVEVVFCVALASLSYYLVERPMIILGAKLYQAGPDGGHGSRTTPNSG